MKLTFRFLFLTLALGSAAWGQCTWLFLQPFQESLGQTPVGSPVTVTVKAGSNDTVPTGFGLTATATGPLIVTDITSTFVAGGNNPSLITLKLTPTALGDQTGTIVITGTCNGTPSDTSHIGSYSYTGLPATTPPFTVGQIPFTLPVIEPVSAATGELFGHDEAPDLDLGGPLDLNFRRYYASYLGANSVQSALGTNWMHNFVLTLAVSGSDATVTLFRGKTVKFTKSNNAWQLSSTKRRPYQLAASGSGFQFMSPASNLIYIFSSTGALNAIADRNGNTITITQGPSGPAEISDGLGRSLTFTYTGSNLTKVQDQANRIVSFEYANGTLSAWTDANGKRSTFTYSSSGSLNALMTTETRPLANSPFTQQFDAQGRVSSQSDSFSNTMSLAYSASTNGSTLTEPLGVSLTAAHDSTFNLTSMTTPDGGSSQYAYDASGRPISAINRLGAKETATWDASSGLVASYTDENSATTTFQYAASMQGGFTFYDLSKMVLADGTSIRYTRDSNGNVTALTDQAGLAWHATWTSQGQIATFTAPSGGVTTFSYGGDGTLASMHTDSGDVTKLGYDSAKRLNQVTRPDTSTASSFYDAVSNLIKATDERNNSVTASFDGNNNLKTIVDALSASASMAYDTDDRVASTTDALGKVIQPVWDALSRLKSVSNTAGNSLNYTYDALNRVTGVTDASGKGVAFGLDAEGRMTSATDALQRTLNVSRDALGRVTSLTTANNEKFRVTYDALGRVTSSTDPLSRVAKFSYDSRGLPASAILPGGVAGMFSRNELGEIIATTDPNGSSWLRAYDKMGRLTSSADPLGQKSTYQYDSRQRLASSALPLGNVQFLYDAAGNLTGQRYSDGTSLNYTYDADNRLTAAGGVALSYDAAGRISASNGLQIGRDAAGRIASITYAAGKTVNYTYDNRGLLTQVADWLGGTTALSYDAAGQLTSIAFPNGVREDYTYDLDGRPLTLQVSKGSTAVSSIALHRDALGRITSADRSAPTVPNVPAGFLALTYDGADQTAAATYDSLGRVTKDAIRGYTWDLASRLKSFSGADGAASFVYDSLGQQTSSSSGGTTGDFVLNYALPLPSVSIVRSAGADQRYYIWLPDGVLLASVEASGARHYYHFDESGSTIFLTNDMGVVTDTYAGTPYGETVIHTGSSDNPFTFQGAFGVMQEGATGLYYMRARYYDSASARFLSRDPIVSSDPRAINPYQFAFANPIERVDPEGTSVFRVDGGNLKAAPAPLSLPSFNFEVQQLDNIVSEGLRYPFVRADAPGGSGLATPSFTFTAGLISNWKATNTAMFNQAVNQLPCNPQERNAPSFTVSVGAQYVFELPQDWRATLRGDFYYQDTSYCRIYAISESFLNPRVDGRDLGSIRGVPDFYAFSGSSQCGSTVTNMGESGFLPESYYRLPSGAQVLPLGDMFALRIAGVKLLQNGFGTNVYLNSRVSSGSSQCGSTTPPASSPDAVPSGAAIQTTPLRNLLLNN